MNDCEECGTRMPRKRTKEVRCADCLDAAEEAAWESHCANFYGGSEPVTIQERCDAARRVKAGQ